MSGIRSPSGVSSGVTGSSKSPASGQGPVSATTPPTPTGGERGLPTTNPQPTTIATAEATLVNAIVTAKSSNENIILHTELGNFRITTPTSLTVGSHISFEVMKVEEVILARLLNVNGKVLSPPLDVRLLPTIEKPLSGAEGYIKVGQLHPLELKAGLQTLATPIPIVKGEVPLPPTSPPAKLSTAPAPPVNGPIAAVAPNNAATIQNEAASRINPQGFNVYQRYHSPSLTASTRPVGEPLASANLPTTNQLPVVEADVVRQRAPVTVETSKSTQVFTEGDKVNLIIRPQKGTTPLTPRPGIMQGTVVALANAPNSGGLAKVTMQTPLGTLSYNTTTPPVMGTNVQFALADEINIFPLPGTDVQQSSARMPKLNAMGDWSNLREAINQIARQDPIVAQTIISQVIPQANSQLSSSLLFFMAALNLGSVEKWLGQDFIQAMKAAGRTPLLQALEEDFATFSRLQSDNGGQDWKSLNFPFFDGNNLRQIRMFHRRHKNPEGVDGEAETTRFLIELNLTTSGPLQLDGLFKNRIFDLAVRSHKDVKEEMRQHIGKLFSEHMEISGLNGQLTFKTLTPFPIDPLKEWEESAETRAGSKFPA
ncbi:hypothetical protein [uncultured Sneathiella sp.]|uniref:hypothetical protein n=1 Tax=uncultured Sneathiella sp. TaxID=879315 RepID=UPI0030DC52C5|tara:strand:+ start:40645 stop:42435 length:1791 start_codon:yes stop_codon:yes gene_type:complete